MKRRSRDYTDEEIKYFAQQVHESFGEFIADRQNSLREWLKSAAYRKWRAQHSMRAQLSIGDWRAP